MITCPKAICSANDIKTLLSFFPSEGFLGETTVALEENMILRWLPTVSLKAKRCKFQPRKLLINFSEKCETKVML